MSLAGRIGTLGATLLALVGAGAQAQTGAVSAEQAPQAWIAYAQRVSQQFQTALAGDSEPAQRFSAWVDQLAAAQTDPDGGTSQDTAAAPPTFRVRVWLDREGTVTRIEADGVDDEQAQADLDAVLTARPIGARPPRGMKQPLVVRLAPGTEL